MNKHDLACRLALTTSIGGGDVVEQFYRENTPKPAPMPMPPPIPKATREAIRAARMKGKETR